MSYTADEYLSMEAEATAKDPSPVCQYSDFLIPRALAMALYRSPVQACGALAPPFIKGGLGGI
ncbi:MAG: hypothetical protein Q8M09_16095 [Pseudomonadota bacterium]|nr:hypothetical protein [Pseudomonadota bacterium]MDP1572729.1 hypothetical protein [Pseudomonadota bacterium]MDP1905741.1 hypothetical protein [Pseudomonadota bacterium]